MDDKYYKKLEEIFIQQEEPYESNLGTHTLKILIKEGKMGKRILDSILDILIDGDIPTPIKIAKRANIKSSSFSAYISKPLGKKGQRGSLKNDILLKIKTPDNKTVYLPRAISFKSKEGEIIKLDENKVRKVRKNIQNFELMNILDKNIPKILKSPGKQKKDLFSNERIIRKSKIVLDQIIKDFSRKFQNKFELAVAKTLDSLESSYHKSPSEEITKLIKQLELFKDLIICLEKFNLGDLHVKDCREIAEKLKYVEKEFLTENIQNCEILKVMKEILLYCKASIYMSNTEITERLKAKEIFDELRNFAVIPVVKVKSEYEYYWIKYEECLQKAYDENSPLEARAKAWDMAIGYLSQCMSYAFSSGGWEESAWLHSLTVSYIEKYELFKENERYDEALKVLEDAMEEIEELINEYPPYDKNYNILKIVKTWLELEMKLGAINEYDYDKKLKLLKKIMSKARRTWNFLEESSLEKLLKIYDFLEIEREALIMLIKLSYNERYLKEFIEILEKHIEIYRKLGKDGEEEIEEFSWILESLKYCILGLIVKNRGEGDNVYKYVEQAEKVLANVKEKETNKNQIEYIKSLITDLKEDL